MTMNSRRRQTGLTLIELMVAIIVVLGLVALAADMMQRDAKRTQNDNAAEWLRIVASGAKAYRNANEATLLSTATATSAATVTPAQLAPFLPAGFSATNSYGQTYSVRFIEPTAGRLDGMVFTTGGDVLSTLDLVYIAGAAKGGAGYIDPANAAQARGPRGNWTRALAAFGGGGGTGRLAYALFYDDVSALSVSDDLSRVAVAGQPEKNRMETAIDMAGNNITSAGDINAQDVAARLTHTSGYLTINSYSTATYGTGAGRFWWNANTGSLSLTNSAGGRGNILVWNVDADGSINAGGNIQAGGEVYATGDIRSANALRGNTSHVNQAYSTGWFRTTGSGGWYSETYGGGWHMSDTTWIRAYANKNVYTAGRIRGGQLESDGRTYVGEYLELQTATAAGGACSPSGLVGRTAAGAILSCVSGVWRQPGETGERYIQYGPQVCGARVISDATCPAGWRLLGGGHVIDSWWGGKNAPDSSYPVTGTTWRVQGNGDGQMCFRTSALCGR